MLNFHYIHLVEVAMSFAIPAVDERSIHKFVGLNHVRIEFAAFQCEACLTEGDVSAFSNNGLQSCFCYFIGIASRFGTADFVNVLVFFTQE